MRRLLDVSLETKINGILIGVMSLIIISLSVFYLYHSSNEYYDNARRLTLQSAKTISFLPSLVDGDDLSDNEKIQALTNKYIFENDIDFVIVKNREGIIISHPDPSMIGEHEPFEEDARANIFGAYYTEQTDKYLEPSILAMAPIYAGDEARQLSGVVKVGYFESKIIEKIMDKLYQLIFMIFTFIIISFFISRWFGEYIKSQTLGYEPKEITMILKNRENIFSALDEGIIASDLSGKIIYVNNAAQEYLNISKNASLDEFNIRNYFGSSMDTMLENDGSRNGIRYFETQLNDKEIIVIVNNLYEKEELSGHVIILRDMTEMSELSNKLTIVESLFDDLRAQSHEYKNRLHLISGLLEMEKYGGIREVLNDEINDIDAYQNNLKGIEADHIKALLIAKMNKANEKRVKFNIDDESQMDNISDKFTINALITIISNLVDNAIEAVVDRKEPEINFYIGAFEGWLEIMVQDNGAGINDEYEIFTKGYSTKDGGINRGYGLFNVNYNVELLNGYIDVKSVEGRTTFTVEVPLIQGGGENEYPDSRG
ncbi:ATP-binding protein [Salinicoccus sp. HZC-1]|uniref:ATP-binding protein n=1 Tax=Salinicoccus sp. HZC-1 TaxID=3385497 RepID=UPI00398A6FE9